MRKGCAPNVLRESKLTKNNDGVGGAKSEPKCRTNQHPTANRIGHTGKWVHRSETPRRSPLPAGTWIGKKTSNAFSTRRGGFFGLGNINSTEQPKTGHL